MTWMTLTEYARRVGVNRRTAQEWARTGRIHAQRTRGGHWRVPEAELGREPATVTEVAAALGVSERTVRGWCVAGKVDAWRLGPAGAWLVERAEIERLKAVQNEGGRRS
jgi:excisionase family DNA binding protein